MSTKNMDLFKEIEKILFSVPMLRAKIENLKLDIEDLKEVNVLPSSSECKGSTPTNAYSSATENEAIRLINVENNDEYESLVQKLRMNERKLKRIENIIGTLSEKEQLLVRMKYFNKATVSQICDTLGYTSEQGYSTRKRTIIISLMPLFKDMINV